MNYMDLRALKDFYSRPSLFVEPIKCAQCKNPIYLSETEIKKRCLYVDSDWTKCLCPSCTDDWKNKNRIKE